MGILVRGRGVNYIGVKNHHIAGLVIDDESSAHVETLGSIIRALHETTGLAHFPSGSIGDCDEQEGNGGRDEVTPTGAGSRLDWLIGWLDHFRASYISKKPLKFLEALGAFLCLRV